MSFTAISPVLNAMAFGGVEIGSGIAREQAFSLNPAIGYPQNGLGVVLGVSIPAPFYAILGSQDANAVRTQTGFETIDKSEFFTAAEIGLRPETPVGTIFPLSGSDGSVRHRFERKNPREEITHLPSNPFLNQ